MASQLRNILKNYFNTGDTPSETEFADLIDSFLHVSEDNPAIAAAYASQVVAASQAEAEAGTVTGLRTWSPERIKQAILALSVGGAGGNTSNYPFANEATFTGFTWLPDYVLDVEITEKTEGAFFRTDGSLKKFRFTYLDTTRIWIECQEDDHTQTGYDLVAYIISGSGFGTEVTWVDVPEQSSSGISARVKINPDARGSGFANIQDTGISQIHPMLLKRQKVPVVPPNGNPNYPWQTDATLAANSAYIQDIRLIFDDASKRFKADGTLRKFWIGYFSISSGTARLFIYGENDAGDGEELFGFILETGFSNPGDVWFWQAVPDPSSTGVRASVYLNWGAVSSSGSATESYDITGIDPYITRLGVSGTASSNHIFETNYRADSISTNGLEAIKDFEIIGKEDEDKEIAVAFLANGDSTLGNAIGLQIRHEGNWVKYAVLANLTDPGNSTTWITADYADMPAGEVDHFSDTIKIRFKIDFSAVSSGVNYLWGASDYAQEPNYIVTNRVFQDDDYSDLVSFLQYWEQKGNSQYGDFNEVLDSSPINIIIDNANNLPAGTTIPAGVDIGMIWLDTSGSTSSPTVKLRLS